MLLCIYCRVAKLVGLAALIVCGVALIVVACVFGLSGCTRTSVRYVTIPVEGKREPCLTDNHVYLHPWRFTKGSTPEAPTDCPDKFDGCLEPLDFVALEMTIRALQARIVEDWQLCGPRDPEEEATTSDAGP